MDPSPQIHQRYMQHWIFGPAQLEISWFGIILDDPQVSVQMIAIAYLAAMVFPREADSVHSSQALEIKMNLPSIQHDSAWLHDS